MIDQNERYLSNEEIGLLLEGKARKLHFGEKTREEFLGDLLRVLATEPGVVVRAKPLRSQGRCSFGRRNEGRPGIAVFVPANRDE